MHRLSNTVGELPLSIQLIAIGLVIALVYRIATGERPYEEIPVVNVKAEGWRRLLPASFGWIFHGKEVLAKGSNECPSCFQVLTGTGYKVIVPNRFANELKNLPELSLHEAMAVEFPTRYPGFEPFKEGMRDGTFMQGIVRRNLTQSLGLITDDLVDETLASMHDTLGEPASWETHLIKQDLLHIVARLSSRVFLGKELCRDANWLRITKNYTIDAFTAARLLRLFPTLLQPICYWLIPTCTKLRREVQEARRLILPEIERRKQRAEAALQAGEKPPKSADTIGWMVENASGRDVDYVACQLGLSLAAIHTTTETMSKCILQLCDTPEVGEQLREEMLEVLPKEGWTREALHKMKLLDSFFRESLRINDLSTTSMNRLVKQDIWLSDGTKLPAGSRITVPKDRVRDPEAFLDPDQFDVTRFLRMRQQRGEESRHQYVTTSPEIMGFGHGEHACPGRFFASNEMKIALCVLLLKYDLRFVPGEARPPDFMFETATVTHAKTKVQIRRREEELDLRKLRQ